MLFLSGIFSSRTPWQNEDMIWHRSVQPLLANRFHSYNDLADGKELPWPIKNIYGFHDDRCKFQAEQVGGLNNVEHVRVDRLQHAHVLLDLIYKGRFEYEIEQLLEFSE
jgi:hypothetical protein